MELWLFKNQCVFDSTDSSWVCKGRGRWRCSAWAGHPAGNREPAVSSFAQHAIHSPCNTNTLPARCIWDQVLDRLCCGFCPRFPDTWLEWTLPWWNAATQLASGFPLSVIALLSAVVWHPLHRKKAWLARNYSWLPRCLTRNSDSKSQKLHTGYS